MLQFITIARKHGQTKWQMVAGPEVSIAEQQAIMREIKSAGSTHPQIAEVRCGAFDEGTLQAVKFYHPDALRAQKGKTVKDHEEWLAKEIKKRSPANAAKAAADKKAAENIEQHKKVQADSERRRKEAAKSLVLPPLEEDAAPANEQPPKPPATTETAGPEETAATGEPAQDL